MDILGIPQSSIMRTHRVQQENKAFLKNSAVLLKQYLRCLARLGP